MIRKIAPACIMVILIALAAGCAKPAATPAGQPGVSDNLAPAQPTGPSQQDTTPPVDQETQRELGSLRRQVELLEAALAPGAPRMAAEAWARGTKTRNGALVFAVLAPELREREKPQFESINWVTGVSSPWVEGFKIVRETKLSATKWEYEVQFSTASSAGKEAPFTNWLVVEQHGDAWFVADVAPGVK